MKKILSLIKKIYLIPKVFKFEGIYGLFLRFLKNLGYQIKYDHIAERKYILEKELIKITNNRVIHGVYKDVYLNCKSNWGGYDFSSKLLGCYEEQIQKKILEIQNRFGLINFVNFGSADGYHIIGSVKNLNFKKGFAFERDKETKKFLVDNLKENGLLDKISVYNDANFNKVVELLDQKELEKTIFLIDIEGNEFDLINNYDLKNLKNSYFIIEDHNFYLNDKTKIIDFNKKINAYFNVEKLDNNGRNPFKYKIINKFNDDDRWLIMSEGRPEKMSWIVLTPKNN